MTRFAKSLLTYAEKPTRTWDLDDPAWRPVSSGRRDFLFVWTTDPTVAAYFSGAYAPSYTDAADFLKKPPYNPGVIEIRSTLYDGIAPAKDLGQYGIYVTRATGETVNSQGSFSLIPALTTIPLPTFPPDTVTVQVQVISLYQTYLGVNLRTGPSYINAPRQTDLGTPPSSSYATNNSTGALPGAKLIVRVKLAGDDGPPPSAAGAVAPGAALVGVVRGKTRRVVGV